MVNILYFLKIWLISSVSLDIRVFATFLGMAVASLV